MAAPDAQDLKLHMQTNLPRHMVPAEIIALQRLPQTPNGKIDRSALLALLAEARQTKLKSAPSTPTEIELSDIWREVFELQSIGVDEDFFELGGTSLLAMQLASKISERLSTSLRVMTVFRHPTIRRMAQHMADDA